MTTELQRFAAFELKRRLKQISDRFPKIDVYDVTAREHGFFVQIHHHAEPMDKSGLPELAWDLLEFILPYEAFEVAADEGLNLWQIIRKHTARDAYTVIDSRMFQEESHAAAQ